MAEDTGPQPQPDQAEQLPLTSDKQAKEIMKSRIETFNPLRRSRILSTRINAAYLCGHQNISVVKGAIVRLPTGMATPVVANLILPAVRNDIAVATKQPAMYDIVPASTDENDRATAKACSKILPYLQRVNGYDLKRAPVILWYDLDGVGWRKVYWDPFYSIDGYDEDGMPKFAGEVVVEHVPNTELIYDFRAKKLDRLEWIIHAKTVTIGYIRERFGDEFVTKIPAREITIGATGENNFEVEVMGQLAEFANTFVQPSAKIAENKLLVDDKVVEYYEYWHRPVATLPTGAYIVMAGDQIAAHMPYPHEAYPHNELPIIPADPLALEGITVGSVPRITQARPMQREYNKIKSLIADNIDAMGNSVLMASRNANINFKRLSNVSGGIIEYDGPMKPSREMGVPISNGYFAYLQECKTNIDEIFSFHQTSKGQMPKGGPRSARGLESLQSADYTQMIPMISGLEDSDRKVVYQMLTLAIANYNDRLLPILGDDYTWTHAKISRKELLGHISVIVKRRSSLPIDKQSESDRAMNIWSSGLLGDPNDPQVRLTTLKQMDLGNIDNIIQSHSKHSNFAKTEFVKAEMMLKDMKPVTENMRAEDIAQHFIDQIYMPPPNGFDDHLVHIKEHTDYIIDNFWKMHGDGAPQLHIFMDLCVEHTNGHSQIEQQRQELQVQQQVLAEMAAKGNLPEQIEHEAKMQKKYAVKQSK